MRGVLFLQEPAGAEQRAGRPEAGDEMGDVRAVAPDLRSGALVVGLRVGRVGVLVEEDPLRVLVRELAGPADGAVRALRAGRLDDLGPPQVEQLATLDGDVRRQDDLQVIATDPADQGQADPGVPGRRLDEHLAGLAGMQDAVLLGLLDERQRDAVLDRTAGVPALELDEDAGRRVRAQLADLDERRVADQVEDAVVRGHRARRLGRTGGWLSRRRRPAGSRSRRRP